MILEFIRPLSKMDLKKALLFATLVTTNIAMPQYDYYDYDSADPCTTFAPGNFPEPELQYK